MAVHSPDGRDAVDDPFHPRPTLAGRYAIERELGRGGMATVYLATDLRHQRPVALKVLRQELTASVGAARFLREIRITCNLVHPHILPLHDSGEADGRIFFATPYVEGETLRRRIEREGRFPVETAVRLALEVADALAYAHARGVVHRDIKPENILLSDGHAVVADFGISRVAGDTLTSTGFAVGTPAYMSPEQASGERVIDGRSDVYSLGCVLYAMLTGDPPFRGATPQAVAAQHLTAAPPSARAARPDVPWELDEVIARALAKSPADRFARAEDVAAALAAVPRPPSARRGVAARRAALAAMAVAATLAAVGAWWVRSSPDGADGAPHPELVVVAPFYVASGDPELRRWKYDLPLLVSPRLDGAAPLRALSPAARLGDLPEVTDRASATALGRRTGAGYVVFGRVLLDGRRAVRVDAEVLDVARGAVVHEVQVTSARPELAPDRALSGVSDSLAHALLAGLGASVPVAATRRAAFGCATSSWAAVSMYLRGEQFYRRTRWDSAIGAYRAAIALDSGCALAYRRIALALSWQRSDGDSAVLRYKLLAGAQNRGLPPRDSLLVASDSLAAAVYRLYRARGTPASVYWAHVHRLFATLEEAARRYPGDPEVWYTLGEARFHWGWGPASTTPEEILGAFDSAIRQDSGFALSYLHPIELALARGGPADAARYVDAYLATEPTDVNAEGVRLAAALLDRHAAASPEMARRLATDSIETLVAARNLLDRWHDSAEVAVRLTRVIAARSGVDTTAVAGCAGGHAGDPALARQLAYRGHLRASYCALGDGAAHGAGGGVLVELALLAGAPAEVAERAFDEWLREGRGYPNYALAWWAARGDTRRLDAFLGRADSLLRAAPDPARREKAGYDTAAARAYRALARGDTADAVRRFATLPRTSCHGCFDFDRLTEARLLLARDSVRAAYRLLREWRGAFNVPTDVLIAYYRGAAAERLGERAAAAAAYRAVAEAWARADPPLQPVVADARRALRRLGAAAGPAAPPASGSSRAAATPTNPDRPRTAIFRSRRPA